MSVYTTVSEQSLIKLLEDYSIGTLVAFKGISEGIENTNYFVTTTEGEYLLTLYERLDAQGIIYCLELIQHYYQSGIKVAELITTKQGGLHSFTHDKPCTFIQKLTGKNPRAPFSIEQLQSLGQAVGQTHRISTEIQAPLHEVNDQQWRWSTAEMLMPNLSKAVQSWLDNEIAFDKQFSVDHLPKGIVHADLFPDNTIFDQDTLSGMIDWNDALHDTLIYDVAITVNAWCSDSKGQLDNTLATAFLDSYHQERPLTPEEQHAWKGILRIAGLRFWLSRTQDMITPPSGELIMQKDPDEYFRIIEQRKTNTPLPWLTMTNKTPILLDARNLLCPMPVIRVQEKIETLNTGDQIKAVCSDPGALHDVPAWARIHGHKVIDTHEGDDNEYTIIVEVC